MNGRYGVWTMQWMTEPMSNVRRLLTGWLAGNGDIVTDASQAMRFETHAAVRETMRASHVEDNAHVPPAFATHRRGYPSTIVDAQGRVAA